MFGHSCDNPPERNDFMIFDATSARARRASVAAALALALAGASVMPVVTASSSQAADH